MPLLTKAFLYTAGKGEGMLAPRIDALRVLLVRLGVPAGVFPLLLDHLALQCTDDVFPLARAMFDEEDAASPTGCKTRLIQTNRAWHILDATGDHSSGESSGEDSSSAQGVLSALAASLISGFEPVLRSASEPTQLAIAGESLVQSLQRLYSTPHAHLSKVDSIVTLEDYCVVTSHLSALTLREVLKFNRRVLRNQPFLGICPRSSSLPSDGALLLRPDPVCENDSPCRLIMLQCMDALLAVHRAGLVHNGICPDAFGVSDAMVVTLRPPSAPVGESPRCNLTRAWRDGTLSNLDYLLAINAYSGRSAGGASEFHAILPWVVAGGGLENGGASPDGPEAERKIIFRDLSKSKFRLKKGDKQLDLTFSQPHEGAAHHVPESLSDLAYYVYMARLTPTRGLQHIVRRNFEPKEYPSSLSRLYEWTPEECPPELFLDQAAFAGSGSLPALCEDPTATVAWHLSCLESTQVRAHLHEWIDLNFGHGLHGKAAVDAMNVPLQGRADSLFLVRSPVFARVFERAHPPHTPLPLSAATSNTAQRRSDEWLMALFRAMLAPKDGLHVRRDKLKAFFYGSDLVQWLRSKAKAASTDEAVALAQQLMRAGFFSPERADKGEDDFVDADDVYCFRERSDPPRAKPDVALPRITNPVALLDDVEHDGLFSTRYYSASLDAPRLQRDDERALGRVFSELCLGVPLVNTTDLDVLPDVVKHCIMSLIGDAPERQLGRCRRMLGSSTLQGALDLLDCVCTAEPDARTQVFLGQFPALSIDSARLVMPMALQLMEHDPTGRPLIYAQLRAKLPGGEPAAQMEAVLGRALPSADLPALDFLPRLVDAALLGSDEAFERLRSVGPRLVGSRVLPLFRARGASKLLLQRLGADSMEDERVAEDAVPSTEAGVEVWSRLPQVSILNARLHHRLVTHTDGPAQCAAGDAKLLAVANKRGEMALFDVSGSRPVERARVKGEGPVEAMRFVGVEERPDATVLALRTSTRKALLMDVATGQRVSPWIPRIRCFEPGPMGCLLGGSLDGDILMMDPRAPGMAHTWAVAANEPVRTLAWSASAPNCVVGAVGEQLSAVDLRGRIACTWRAPFASNGAKLHRIFASQSKLVLVRGDLSAVTMEVPSASSTPKELLRVRGGEADDIDDVAETCCLLFGNVYAARGDDVLLWAPVEGTGETRLMATRMLTHGGQRLVNGTGFSFAASAGNMLLLGGVDLARPVPAQQAWVRAMSM